MKKKFIVIGFIIISLFGIFSLTNNGRADPVIFQVHYLSTNKEVYYNNETVNINASWDANPISIFEEIYIRIEIWDTTDNVLWYSPWDDRTGDDLTGEWNVKIDDLNLPINQSSNNLSVQFHFLYIQDTGFFESLPISKGIQAIKRNVTCQMIDFNAIFKNGEIFHFKAKFFFLEIDTNLSNYVITVKLKSESLIIYEENFTTDLYGIIEVNLFIPKNSTFGNLVLLLELVGDAYFNGSNFEFQLLIESNLNEKSNSNDSDSEDKNDKNNKNIYILSIALSLLGISFLTILFGYHNNIKKSKDQKLADLTCKY